MNDDALYHNLEESLLESIKARADYIRQIEKRIGARMNLLNDTEAMLNVTTDNPGRELGLKNEIEKLKQRNETDKAELDHEYQERMELIKNVLFLHEKRQEGVSAHAVSSIAEHTNAVSLAQAVGFDSLYVSPQLSVVHLSTALGDAPPLPTPPEAPVPLPFPRRPQSLDISPYTYIEHQQPVYRVAWSPDGKRIASCGADSQVRIWEAATGKTIFPIEPGHADSSVPVHTGVVGALAWSSDGQYLASASMEIIILDTRDADPCKWRGILYPQGSPAVTALSWEPNGSRLIAARANHAEIWDTQLEKKISTYQGHSKRVRAVAWHPQEKCAASASGNFIWIWFPADGEEADNRQFDGRSHADIITALAWSPDGKYIAAGIGDYDKGEIEVWDTLSKARQFMIDTHDAPVTAIAWSPGGEYLATGSQDTKAKIWNATTGELLFTYEDHSQYVLDLTWSPDGRYIASAGMDHVQVWQPAL